MKRLSLLDIRAALSDTNLTTLNAESIAAAVDSTSGNEYSTNDASASWGGCAPWDCSAMWGSVTGEMDELSVPINGHN